MKFHLLALPLVAFLPACATAQLKPATETTEAAPQSPIDPAAQALLERAMATYKDATGIRFRVANSVDGKDRGASNLAFARPNLLNIERQIGENTMRLLLDGSDFYMVQGTTYRKLPAPPATGTPALMGGVGGTSGQLIGAMIDGKNPIEALQTLYSTKPFQNFKGSTVALAPRVVDGDVLSGIQSTFSFGIAQPGGKAMTITQQITAWFGGAPLSLRRVQTRYTQGDKVSTMSEKISDQQISPTFEEGAFKFNDTGLKLASEEEGANQKYWDARLTVGADPFAFSTKTLDGKPISLESYKGKVVLLDFWATWCGPCVAALPELQATYKKYHAQGLEVVGISFDEDKSALTSFIKDKKMAWPQVFDGKGWGTEIGALYGVKAIPFVLLVGRDGKIAAVNPRDDLDGAVKKALAAG